MANETEKNLTKVKDQVYNILEEHPETRNDDRLLLLAYWSKINGIKIPAETAMLFAQYATSPESITRVRRKIQSQGLFPPTEEDVIKQRRQREQDMREHYGSQS